MRSMVEGARLGAALERAPPTAFGGPPSPLRGAGDQLLSTRANVTPSET